MSDRGLIHMHHFIKYSLVQLTGAFVGAILGMFVSPTASQLLIYNASLWSLFIIQCVFTFMLCYVTLNVATTENQKDNHYYGLAISFIVGAIVLVCGPSGGVSINAASLIAVYVVHKIFGIANTTFYDASPSLWSVVVFLIAGVIGASLSSLAFRVTRPQEYSKDVQEFPLA
eukprot:GHVR01157356.1.p1 GENE.GHVR01157356.1~~GHVR01157356.1.p1  ORF type:complete len:172 (+),score=25.47 GHVR01157356.1:360-875(+)